MLRINKLCVPTYNTICNNENIYVEIELVDEYETRITASNVYVYALITNYKDENLKICNNKIVMMHGIACFENISVISLFTNTFKIRFLSPALSTIVETPFLTLNVNFFEEFACKEYFDFLCEKYDITKLYLEPS